MNDRAGLQSNPLVFAYTAAEKEFQRIARTLATRKFRKQALALARRKAETSGAIEDIVAVWNLEKEVSEFRDLARAKKLAILDVQAAKSALMTAVLSAKTPAK